MHPDSLVRLWRYINLLLTYLLYAVCSHGGSRPTDTHSSLRFSCIKAISHNVVRISCSQRSFSTNGRVLDWVLGHTATGNDQSLVYTHDRRSLPPIRYGLRVSVAINGSIRLAAASAGTSKPHVEDILKPRYRKRLISDNSFPVSLMHCQSKSLYTVSAQAVFS